MFRDLADTGLAGPVGIAGATLLTLLTALFYLFSNLILKTGRRADELNKSVLADKDAIIVALQEQVKELTSERDHWFKKYDQERTRP